ncbi:MAG: (Fe-S)-binding protein [Candidatus ainarchaeum sp.]|nr:(Fe-S)-binding protein [Candidatus ainarchaeum sp.]
MGLFDKLKGMGGNTLYYPGCLTKFVGKDLEDNYKKIFNKIGIDFIQLKDLEVCCGSPILNAGYKEEAINLARKNFKVFKEHGVKKIITACPSCYYMFDKIYPSLLKDWDINVEHATQVIARAIKEKKINPKNINFDITYHDPCHLGRYSTVYSQPREIISSFGNLKEMKLNKNYSFCCGGGSGVKTNYPKLAKSASKERIKMAKETNADFLTTSCPMCFYHLKENAGDLKVKELSELLLESLEKNGE